jgi:hypothetical protein
MDRQSKATKAERKEERKFQLAKMESGHQEIFDFPNRMINLQH